MTTAPRGDPTLATAKASRPDVSVSNTRHSSSQMDSADDGSVSGGDRHIPRPEMNPAHKARLLRQLQASVTPHQDSTALPDIFGFRRQHANLYKETSDQKVKNEILWETQCGSAIAILHSLKKNK